jgi:hypothetical protein
MADPETAYGAARDYIERSYGPHRALFDRVHALIVTAYPDVVVVMSYQLPTYRVGRRRLYLGIWKHGISLYGWPQGRDGGFIARHPELLSGKATIRIRTEDAAGISDDELTSLIHATLGEG